MTLHSYWQSNCAVLEVGCYLQYWNGSTWVNADEEPNVVSGKFSDGTYCYTVSAGIITTKAACLTQVNITICGPNQADGGGMVTLYAYADTAVDTNVDVPVRWVGDLSSTLNGTITITSGNTCGSNTLSGANSGENVSIFAFNGSISPAQSATQEYVQSTASTSNSCTTC